MSSERGGNRGRSSHCNRPVPTQAGYSSRPRARPFLTGWSIAIAAWTYGRTPNMTGFAQFAEPGSWKGHGTIVYLFAPAFLQGLASLFLAIPLLPRRIQSRVHIGFIPRRWHLLLLMLFIIFWLCDTHLRSARALRSATVGKQSQLGPRIMRSPRTVQGVSRATGSAAPFRILMTFPLRHQPVTIRR
jgi:hypothetical protein